MILGLLAGNILNALHTPKEKLRSFVVLGAALVAVGVLLHFTGINPIVKRIWTPAWTLFSGGLCFLFLAFFYWIIDMEHKKRWSFFLTVIGVNSIAAYVIADGGIRAFISKSLYIHLGANFDQVLGLPYATLVAGGITLFLEWLILYWMYKRKIFIKI